MSILLQCSRCKVDQIASHDKDSQFHKCANTRRGFAWECKTCRKAVAAAKYRGEAPPPTIGFEKKYEPQTAVVFDSDCAYAAGLIDAEGSFTICGASTQYASRLAIYNNDDSALMFVRSVFGGRLYDVRRQRRKDCVERVLGFETQSNLKFIASRVLPFLKIKSAQCETVLRAVELSPKDRAIERDAIVILNQRCQPVPKDRPVAGAQRSLSCVSPNAWAYFAGMIDGDGSFQLQPQASYAGVKNHFYYPWVLVYSTKREALDYLYEIFGGTLKFRDRKNRWSLEGTLRFEDQAYTPDIMAGIMPYLKSKRAQCELLLQSLKVASTKRLEFRKQLEVLNAKFRRKSVT